MIAGDKYKLDLKNLDAYLPKGAAFFEKVAQLEKKLINEAMQERKEIRVQIRTKNAAVE